MQSLKQSSTTGQDSVPLEPHPTNLIINYLPNDTTEEELLTLFSAFGKIRSLKIVRDPSGACAGYGFVDFENARCAKAAQLVVNGRQVREKRLKVAFALPRGCDIGKCNLFVRFLPVDVSEVELENLFEAYGRIWAVKILPNKVNASMSPQRNTAYVRFRQPADAERARIDLDGYRFPGSLEPISVQTARSVKREDRKADGAQATEETRWNPSPPPPPNSQVKDSKLGSCAKYFDTTCVCEMAFEAEGARFSPVPEVPVRPKGFIFPALD